jgi:hypothetical protein
MIFYLAAIFFYTMMTGMVGSYRQAYLVNVLRMGEDQVSFYNGFLSVAGFVMSFVYALIIDNRKIGKRGKFIPIVNAVAIPARERAYGDMDFDGDLDNNDVSMLKEYLSKYESEFDKIIFNVFDDESYDIYSRLLISDDKRA